MNRLTFIVLWLLCLMSYAQNRPDGSGSKPSDGIQIGGWDGTKFNYAKIATDGSLLTSGGGGSSGGLTDAELRSAAVPVSMAAVPVGAATAAAQATAQATLATIATNTTIPTLTRFRNTAVTNAAVAVKASAGNVYGWNVINPNTVPTYVKFYDIAAGSVTVGTSPVTLTLAIPANGAFFVRSEMVPQQSFTTAIAVAAVSGLADNSAAAPSSAVHVSVQYQ